MRNQIGRGGAHGRARAHDQFRQPRRLGRRGGAVKRDQVDILLISPERLANERFRAQVLARIAVAISLW